MIFLSRCSLGDDIIYINWGHGVIERIRSNDREFDSTALMFEALPFALQPTTTSVVKEWFVVVGNERIGNDFRFYAELMAHFILMRHCSIALLKMLWTFLVVDSMNLILQLWVEGTTVIKIRSVKFHSSKKRRIKWRIYVNTWSWRLHTAPGGCVECSATSHAPKPRITSSTIGIDRSEPTMKVCHPDCKDVNISGRCGLAS